jgi:5,10-methylenetetrahydrofolate reductase
MGGWMPYKSEAQRKKFHALLKEGKLSKEIVDEFDAASKHLLLEPRAPKKKPVATRIKTIKVMK